MVISRGTFTGGVVVAGWPASGLMGMQSNVIACVRFPHLELRRPQKQKIKTQEKRILQCISRVNSVYGFDGRDHANAPRRMRIYTPDLDAGHVCLQSPSTKGFRRINMKKTILFGTLLAVSVGAYAQESGETPKG